MTKRRRKSSISRLPDEQRAYIERLMRGGRLTLDEMIEDLKAKFPGEPAAEVSRSALHRYDQQVAELTARMREIDTAARVVVEELGESPDDRAGALLTQSITTLATHAALNAQQGDGVSIEEVRKLARAARDVIAARSMSLKERQAIEAAARQKLLREQETTLEEAAKAQGLGEDQVRFWREKFLGIRS